MASPWGCMFYIDVYMENMKKSSWHGALIFGREYRLVDLFQVCPNYAPDAKNGPAPEVTCFT